MHYKNALVRGIDKVTTTKTNRSGTIINIVAHI